VRRIVTALVVTGLSGFGLAIAVGISPAAATPTPNPCGLITKAQMSTAMGVTITSSALEKSVAGDTCTYSVNPKDSDDGYATIFDLSTAGAASVAKSRHTTNAASVDGFKKYYLTSRGSLGPAFDQALPGLGKVAGLNAPDNEIDVLGTNAIFSISVAKFEGGMVQPFPKIGTCITGALGFEAPLNGRSVMG